MNRVYCDCPTFQWTRIACFLVRRATSARLLFAVPHRFIVESMETVICSQCDKPEQECQCDRYCCLCMGHHAVRLCMDGLYYCPACREACDTNVANPSDASSPYRTKMH
jgi:hypothetical protein